MTTKIIPVIVPPDSHNLCSLPPC